jgi:transcriptional regulator with XRE-family HTH domain
MISTMTKRTLGSVVKEARYGARMTQRDLAAAIGVKASHIARYRFKAEGMIAQDEREFPTPIRNLALRKAA